MVCACAPAVPQAHWGSAGWAVAHVPAAHVGPLAAGGGQGVRAVLCVRACCALDVTGRVAVRELRLWGCLGCEGKRAERPCTMALLLTPPQPLDPRTRVLAEELPKPAMVVAKRVWSRLPPSHPWV